jgi:hypothetical protein
MGHKRTSSIVQPMSALPPKADIDRYGGAAPKAAAIRWRWGALARLDTILARKARSAGPTDYDSRF